jgi:hypothetical protein
MELTPVAAALVISEVWRETATRFEVSIAAQRRSDEHLIEVLDVLVGVPTASGVPA